MFGRRSRALTQVQKISVKTRENNCDNLEKQSSFLSKLLKGKRLKFLFVVVSECDAQSAAFIDNIVRYLDKQSYKNYGKLSVVIANYGAILHVLPSFIC